MNWIKMAVSMKGDPSVHGIAKDCCKHDIAKAIGHLQCFFAELPAHARDGNLSEVDAMTVEQWALWSGKRGAFNDAVRKYLCDGTQLRSWEKYNGAAIRENDAARERMRLKREAERAEKDEPSPPERKAKRSPDRSPNVPRTFPSDGTGREESSSNDDDRAGEPRASSSADRPGDRAELEAVLGLIPDAAHRDAIRGYALRQPASKLLAIAGTLRALGPGGAQQVASTWYQLGRGTVDAIMASDSAAVSANMIRGCVRKAPTEAPAPLTLVRQDEPGTVRDDAGKLVWYPGCPERDRPTAEQITANGWSVAA